MNWRCQFSITILLLSVIYTVQSDEKVRWCVISDAENTKCWAMVDALKVAGITPEMECVMGANVVECMEKIEAGDAHLITLDGGDIYHAGSLFGMKPIMGEEYSYGRYYYAVAVIRAADAGQITFQTMKGKKSCHTGVRKTSGWNVPVGYMINAGFMTVDDCQGDIKAASGFFSQSCAPGALNKDYRGSGNPLNLCELCSGIGLKNCAKNDDEPYYNYPGAFRCLVEGGGDVAFVKHTTVQDVIREGDWASSVSAANYHLLCKDGTTVPVDRYQDCNLAKVIGHGVMTSGSASSSDVAKYQKLLTDAQKKFGSDGATGFKMFDSSDSAYGEGAGDLMFKDATEKLYDVDTQTYQGYLGEDYMETLQGLNQCGANSVRWCAVGDPEAEKCRAMKAAFTQESLPKNISCYQAEDHLECMQLIKDGMADAVTLDGGDAYKAGKDYGLVPVAGERYSADLEGTSYYAVAVVKKATSFSINDLKGKKSCHTGIMKTSGWNMPVGYLVETGKISIDSDCDVAEAVGNYFSASCVPGAKSSKYDTTGNNPSSLCELCKGSGDDKCARNSDEPYFSYAGAFRCLAESAGDVAFVKHTTVADNTGGTNSDPWAAGLNSADYELLCRDGTRKPVAEWKSCNLGRVPSHAVMTNKDQDRAALWNLLNKAQQKFGRSSSGAFKMFDSAGYDGADLLFKDSTLDLVAVGARNTYKGWLGEEYLKALQTIHCDTVSSAPGKALLSPVLTTVVVAIKYLM